MQTIASHHKRTDGSFAVCKHRADTIFVLLEMSELVAPLDLDSNVLGILD